MFNSQIKTVDSDPLFPKTANSRDFSGSGLQIRIMSGVSLFVFIFTLVILVYFQYEMYALSVRSSEKSISLVHAKYQQSLNLYFDKITQSFQLFQELAAPLVFAINLDNFREIRALLAKKEEEGVFQSVGIHLADQRTVFSQIDLKKLDNQEGFSRNHTAIIQWDPKASSYFFVRPLWYDEEFLGHTFAHLNMDKVQGILNDYHAFLEEHGYLDSSVFLKGQNIFAGRNLSFEQFEILRMEEFRSGFRLVGNHYLFKTPIRLLDGTMGILGNMVPRYEVMKTLYRAALLGVGATFSLLVCILFLIYYLLDKTIQPVKRGAQKVEESSFSIEEISSENSSLSQSLNALVKMQSDSIQKTAAQMEEVAKVSQDNFHRSKKARFVVNLANESAFQGSRTMQKLAGEMEELNRFSKDMIEIVRVIKGISSQIDILAINASIEALRAGEKGRDFGIVASEVAKLAHSTLDQSVRIEGVINESIQTIHKGYVSTEEVQKILDEISAQVAEATKAISLIAEESEKQSESMIQLSSSVLAVDKQTQRNRDVARKISVHGSQLEQSSRILMEVVHLMNEMVGGESKKATSQNEFQVSES